MDAKMDDIFKSFVNKKLKQLGMNGESTVELEKSLQQSALDKMEAKLSNNLHSKVDTKEKHKEKKSKKHKKEKKKKKKKEKKKDRKKESAELVNISTSNNQKPSKTEPVLVFNSSDNNHNHGNKKVILKKKLLEEEAEVVIENKEIRGYFDTVSKLKEIEKLPLSFEQTAYNKDDSFKQEGPQNMDNSSEANAFLSISVPRLSNAAQVKKNYHLNSVEKHKSNNKKDSKNKHHDPSVIDVKSKSSIKKELKDARKIESNVTEIKSVKDKDCKHSAESCDAKATSSSTDATTMSTATTAEEKSANGIDASVIETNTSPSRPNTNLTSNSKVDPSNNPEVICGSESGLEPGEIPDQTPDLTNSVHATNSTAIVEKDAKEGETSSSKRSRSRSRSKKRSKSSRSHRRSRSRSKKRSKRSSSRHRSRSRSKKRSKRSHSRRRSRSRSKKRSRRSSSRNKSRSRSPRRHKHHHHHRSGESHKSSRHRSSRHKRSPIPLISAGDKVKLLEIAKANVLAQHKADITVSTLSHESKALLRSGGVTLQQLTGVCQDIAQGKREILAHSSNVGLQSGPASSKVHHPFQVKDTPSISINISSRMAIMPPPPSKPINELTKEFPVSCGSQHQRKEVLEEVYGKWEPIVKDKETKSEMKAIIDEKVFPDPPQEDNTLTIKEVIAQRVTAARELQSNPSDVKAIKNMFETQQKLDSWTCAKQIPGRFTGSTGLQPLKRSELERGHQPWASNNSFNSEKQVVGIGKSLLKKMGWKEGESLGKTNAGMLEPLRVQVKTDRKGLSSIMEMPAAPAPPARKTGGHVVLRDLSGKHPVSALMEICSKRRWKPPDFTLVQHDGPDHSRSFLFKVTINDASYQPDTSSINKKQAKCQAATAALQAMGLIPS